MSTPMPNTDRIKAIGPVVLLDTWLDDWVSEWEIRYGTQFVVDRESLAWTMARDCTPVEILEMRWAATGARRGSYVRAMKTLQRMTEDHGRWVKKKTRGPAA